MTHETPPAREPGTAAGRRLLNLLHELSPGGHYSARVRAIEAEALRGAAERVGQVAGEDADIIDGDVWVRVSAVRAAILNGAPEAERTALECVQLIRGGIEAFRLTREYVGEETLPAIEGWSWYDWCQRAEAWLRTDHENVGHGAPEAAGGGLDVARKALDFLGGEGHERPGDLAIVAAKATLRSFLAATPAEWRCTDPTCEGGHCKHRAARLAADSEADRER